jgi:DNA modification methylase
MKKILIENLKPYKHNARTHSAKQIAQIARSIKEFGFNNPVLIDEDNTIIAGHGRVEAAKKLGLTEIPVVKITHLTEAQKRAYILADNRLAEKAGWDKDILAIELQNLVDIEEGFDISITGFETAEIDLMLYPQTGEEKDYEGLEEQNIPKRAEFGDLWQLGHHRLLCGDSLHKEAYERLLGLEKATIIVTDPPYNVKIDGHVCGKGKTKHKEFAMASGEMSDTEFIIFLKKTCQNMADFSRNGSLHFLFMDWRGAQNILTAGSAVYDELKNIAVWNKLSGGMGSLYRSQHELVFIYKNGTDPHINNIELGAHGRYRTNVWDYPGIFINNRLNKENIKLHPTVKPVGLLADILLDASKPHDIVLDPFGGSGSTLLAAERTGRKARLIEIDPHYCDVILHRSEKISAKKAVKLEGTL